MTIISFSSGMLSATADPEHGGRLASLCWIGAGGRRDLVVPMNGWPGDPLRWPKAGAYPLIPYSNRIMQARLAMPGRQVALRAHPDAQPHTLHGPAQLRRWATEKAEADGVTLVLFSAGDADWPWPYEARQRFVLDGATLRLGMEIINRGEEPFPAGLGWHPYLPLGQGAALRHDARLRWPFDAAFVSTGVQQPGTAPFGRTEYLSGWSSATLAYSDGVCVHLTADPVFGHLVCHQPDTDAYLCLEPVSHASNGFNLAAAGVPGTGTHMLAPGACLKGEIRLSVTAGDALS